MGEQYKLILSSRKVFREVSLGEETQRIKIGTQVDADVRLPEKYFYEAFSFTAMSDDGRWKLRCGDNIYISDDDVRKLMVLQPEPGARFSIRYKEYDIDVLSVRFVRDFEQGIKKYDRAISLEQLTGVRIGTDPSCELCLEDVSAGQGSFSVVRELSSFVIKPEKSYADLFLNGNKISGPCRLREMDFISMGAYSFCFSLDTLYTDKESRIAYKGNIRFLDLYESSSHHEYPRFSRSSRVLENIDLKEIEILDPPSEPKEPEVNIVTQLFPAIGMLAVVVILRGAMGTSGASYILMSVASMGIGIATSVMNIISGKKKYAESVEKRKEVYAGYIERKRESIQSLRAEEARVLDGKYYSPEKELRLVDEFSASLFDRRMEDEDFLEVRLGTGSREAQKKISYKLRERLEDVDELMKEPVQIEEEYKMLSGVPITLRLSDINAAGFTGPSDALYNMAKILTLDIAVRHYYEDVKLVFCLGEKERERFDWLAMLPHVQNDITGRRNIICDDESRGIVLEYLYRELTHRDKNHNCPRLVVLVYQDTEIQTHPVAELITSAREKGITFLFFNEYGEFLSASCTSVIELESSFSGRKIDCMDGTKAEAFTMAGLQDGDMRRAIKKLAPVYCEKISLERTLTASISFFELLGIYGAEDIDLGYNWSHSEVYRTMAVPLGVRAQGQKVYLDIHEKQHGPHGLVAGTTGSGKSEILQSYILSMALRFHPHDVSFMIIDFKGGGMANQFRDLPHMAGMITNIDGREIQRSLLSIRAELKKRQELFAQYDVNHIDAYIKLYKQNVAEKPLPHLIVIVDEFAELKMEQPEFMKELVSAARIGRSLGVHLILATQKPSGVVDPQIWSNSRFKLCLKVQTREDSNEVLKNPLAAEIVEPGRAYLQVGNNEIFELFQSAYSGGSSVLEGVTAKKAFFISKVELSGKRNVIFEQKREEAEEARETQLESIVRHISSYCRSHGIMSLPYICLPPLPEVLEREYQSMPGSPKEGLAVDIGLLDDPQNQYQGALELNVTAGNTMIIGSAQSGKTNLLQEILKELVCRFTPEDLNIYVFDFGSMIFRNYEKLHHVGGVVCANEDEKCKNLLKLLDREIKDRKEKLAAAGVGSYSAYLEAGLQGIPQIVVLIDNLTAFRETYMSENDTLLPLCREGIAAGISFVIANLQTGGIGYKYLSNFSNRIALYCNDSSEYSSLFNGCRMQPLNTPGRCLTEKNKVVYECQTTLAFAGEREIDRVGHILNFVDEINSAYPNSHAKPIPLVPERLTEEELETVFKCVSSAERLALGVDYAKIEPVFMDWQETSVFALSGKDDLGRSAFARYLLKAAESVGAALYIVDDMAGTFGAWKEGLHTACYTRSAGDMASVLGQLERALDERYMRFMENPMETGDTTPILAVFQNAEAVAVLGEDKQLAVRYKNMLNKYKEMRFVVLFANLENAAISFSAPEPLKMLKDNRYYIVFENISNIKLFDVPLSVSKNYKKPLDFGDAYLLRENVLIKMKVMQSGSGDR